MHQKTFMKPMSSRKRLDLARLFSPVREYIDQLVQGENLRAKTTRGAVLVGGASVAEQASRFARNMLLARLLAPSAFGTMAIVMSSSSIIGTLSDVGLRVSVIRNPRGRESAYLNAAWWLAMGRPAWGRLMPRATWRSGMPICPRARRSPGSGSMPRNRSLLFPD